MSKYLSKIIKIDLLEEKDLIDEDELVDFAQLPKSSHPMKSGSACAPKGCYNCTCGKVTQNTEINDVVSVCGNCYKGDGFRCDNCSHKGTPPFEPGQILKDNFINKSYMKLIESLN